MITIIHGDDTAASRTYYQSLKKKDGQTYDGDKITLATVHEALQNNGLFEDEKFFYLESFLSKRKPSKEMEAIIAALNEYGKNATILLWEGKMLTKKQIATFPVATPKEFFFPKSLFTFLDSFLPHNTNTLLRLYHETLKTVDAEMILVMIIRQIRILLALSDTHADNPIREAATLAPWQKKKLLSQLDKFSPQQLIQLYETLYDIEVKSKTGGLPLPLSQTIDFFLLAI